MNTLTGLEKPETLDFSTEFNGEELKLIQAIRLGDLDKDPALHKRYLGWLGGGMEAAKSDEVAISQATLLIKKAKLLFQAGKFNEAFGEAMDARTNAENMRSKLGETGGKIIDEANAIMLFVVEQSA